MFSTNQLKGGKKNTTLMSWIINFVLMELMKILLEMEPSSPSLVFPQTASLGHNSGLEVFKKAIKSRNFLQDHPSLCFCTELTSEAPSYSISLWSGLLCCKANQALL